MKKILCFADKTRSHVGKAYYDSRSRGRVYKLYPCELKDYYSIYVDSDIYRIYKNGTVMILRDKQLFPLPNDTSIYIIDQRLLDLAVTVKNYKNAQPLIVALDLVITPDLLEDGLKNEIQHELQLMRKDSEFEIQDRIRVKICDDCDEKIKIAIN